MSNSTGSVINGTATEQWPTFWEILQRLHREGIYLHPEQLAEFMLCHGLPVDLRYVPPHLQQKAQALNANYRGDMAKLSQTIDDQNWFLEDLAASYERPKGEQKRYCRPRKVR
ncbi:hypothetical protein BST81_26040 [Leptolyngbya sp. 'hensonii']|nr:hypothetical protein BST81_26040 [Leptolyngbya sp. 'hensonii']